MKKLFIILLLCCTSSLASLAQGLKMRDLFAAIPDSLLPTMTKNNRLDCIDFIENDMEAKVRDRLGRFVELKTMTHDYLLLELSEVCKVEVKYVAQTDTTGVVFLVRTYLGPAADSHVECYDQNWNNVKVCVERPTVESFFSAPSAEHAETLHYAISELKDLTLLCASLSDSAPTLTWTIALDELSVDDKKVAKQYVQPVLKPLNLYLP